MWHLQKPLANMVVFVQGPNPDCELIGSDRLSLGSHGFPRMAQELKELELQLGQRRVARILRDNGIQVRRSRKFKSATDSDHSFNIAPNRLNQDFAATATGPFVSSLRIVTFVMQSTLITSPIVRDHRWQA